MLAFSVLFVVIVLLTAVSWRSLKQVGCHGFYRYFAFVAIAVQIYLASPVWFVEQTSVRQLFSWSVLSVSVLLVISALVTIKTRGGRAQREQQAHNLAFENTAHLITQGVFRYIRHPMYTSLMLLSIGVMLKQPDVLQLCLVLVSLVFLALTAQTEERENIAFFGEAYEQYAQKTARYLPFIY